MSASRKTSDGTVRPEAGTGAPATGRQRRLLSEAQEAEVREQRETRQPTRRVTVPACAPG